MLPRERVRAAIEYRAPDRLPLRIFAAPGGLHEHGRKLADLIRECGHDFGPLDSVPLPPAPGPEDFDPDGRYHAVRTDAWGVTWEYRIYGVWGHPIRYPVPELAGVDTYQAPPAPAWEGPEIDAGRPACEAHKARYYLLHGAGSLFHTLHSIRPFEELLADIAADEPAIHRLADKVAEHMLGHIRRGLALGADGIAIGDDFGTQESLLFSLPVWRRFFKPRYQALFEPIRRAGKEIFFHSCGQIAPLLEEFAALGVSAVWPQLTAFDVPDLARRCRDLRLAVEIHPDRGEVMQRRTPAEVRDHVLRLLDTFDTASGGSWLYIEIDPGFPWENVAALFDAASEVRGTA